VVSLNYVWSTFRPGGCCFNSPSMLYNHRLNLFGVVSFCIFKISIIDKMNDIELLITKLSNYYQIIIKYNLKFKENRTKFFTKIYFLIARILVLQSSFSACSQVYETHFLVKNVNWTILIFVKPIIRQIF